MGEIEYFPHGDKFSSIGRGTDMESYSKDEVDLKLDLQNEKTQRAFDSLSSDIKVFKSEIFEKIESSKNTMVKWFIVTAFAIFGVVAGLIYFVHTSNQQFMSILVEALK